MCLQKGEAGKAGRPGERGPAGPQVSQISESLTVHPKFLFMFTFANLCSFYCCFFYFFYFVVLSFSTLITLPFHLHETPVSLGNSHDDRFLLVVLQGARGFPGTPGLPGIKGHRVSLSANLQLLH